MKRFFPALAAATSLAACVPASAPPAPSATPEPAPSPTPAPEPAPAFTPPPVNWMDQPASPGNWFYVARPPYSMAVFGSSERDFDFAMRCDPASRTVSLGRVSGLTSPQPMRVLTETASRTLSAQPRQGSIEQLLAADLAAGDPLLDAMAISKGRFAVETGGMPVLYIPSWPEVTRVIEDCR